MGPARCVGSEQRSIVPPASLFYRTRMGDGTSSPNSETVLERLNQ